MTSEQFTYWLQGFVELTDSIQPSEAQWKAIKDHLKLVFKKETPNIVWPVPVPPVQFPQLGPQFNPPVTTC